MSRGTPGKQLKTRSIRPGNRIRLRRWGAAKFAGVGSLAVVVALACPSAVAVEDHSKGHADSAPKLSQLPTNAWAANSINTSIFRADPIASDEESQFVTYYNPAGEVVVAKRALDGVDWESAILPFKGNLGDAHNGVVIGVDSAGYVHLAWDHHNNPLHYARSTEPGSLTFSDPMPMTGKVEGSVTYPQFFKLDDGTLLFMYRDGSSGNGNTVLNRYDPDAERWTQLHDNLVSGEGQRNAYTQAAAGPDGSLHLSWVWRETWDVSTNHDICYAYSPDGGQTWQNSTGDELELPITQATAEVALPVPQRHELINQTSMCTDSRGRPVIATYFRPEGETVPQFFVVYHDGEQWHSEQASQRTTPFSLSGGGTKRIPISRPQILAEATDDGSTAAWLLMRDIDDGNGHVTALHTAQLGSGNWSSRELTDFSVDLWEPAYDRSRWERDGVLSLYVQKAGQGDGEGTEDVPPQPAFVLDWDPTP